MTRWSSFFFLFLLLAAVPASPAEAPVPESIQFGRFGSVPVVHPQGEPKQVVLLLSGKDGLGAKEAEMASFLAHDGALVFEVDSPRYLQAAVRGQGRCIFPAADFEALSQFGQMKLGVASYKAPILVGIGTGSGLAYTAIAQAPPNTFLGAVSAGFCEVVESTRPLCPGNGLKRDHNWKQGGQHLLPRPDIEDPWIILRSPTDAQCIAGPFDGFNKSIPLSKVIPLPAKTPAADAWKGQLQQAMASLAERSRQAAANAPNRNNELRDLPLAEVAADPPEKNALAVVVSGSGGWTSIDRKVGNQLAARGVPAIGISAATYFWKPRNPDGTGQDLTRILNHYLAAWHKEKVIVVGYSQGADVVPFMVNRLPPPLRAKVALVALIGPDPKAQFHLHPDGWMSGRDPDPDLPVAPEIARLKGLPVLCVLAEKELDSLCPSLDPKAVERFQVPGSHDFQGQAPAMAEKFVARAGLAPHGSAAGKPARP
ncbi:MAG TPA: AcvB/VirJ family lysyl-phosphatidylglycerol hydrolase [Thermoanaerobaculia bacterium]|nr:AcvB/VirJ family lysyl-phosphatidylglycerol hydrolase [Thermoanaerobaculia bacterium]